MCMQPNLCNDMQVFESTESRGRLQKGAHDLDGIEVAGIAGGGDEGAKGGDAGPHPTLHHRLVHLQGIDGRCSVIAVAHVVVERSAGGGIVAAARLAWSAGR